jgi:uncharacterized protein (DUF2237 family)
MRMSKEKQCWICRRTEQEVKTILEKLSPEIPSIANDKDDDNVMVTAKTHLYQDELKGIYRCVICECILMDMADHTISVRTQEDLLTEDDLERIHFDISATIEPDYSKKPGHNCR